MNVGKLAAMFSLVLLMAGCGGAGGRADDAVDPRVADSTELEADVMVTAMRDASAELPSVGDEHSVVESDTEQGVDELPWASVNGVAVVNGRTVDGDPVDYVFLNTMAAGDGKLYYRSVKGFANAYSEAWDAKGWREMPYGMRSSEKLAAAWVSGDANTVYGRNIWIAAIDQSGRYRIASYKPIDIDGKERWSGWFDMGAAGPGDAFDGPPAIVSYGGWVRLMGVRNGQLWMKSYSVSQNAWSTWVRDSDITLKPATGVAASAMEFGAVEPREEQMVLFAVNHANKVFYRRFLKAGVQPWYEVPGGGLTDTTPTVARSSRDALRVVIKGTNSSSLWFQTMRSDTYYTWPVNTWSPLTSGDFDSLPSGYAGSGGPSAVWVPPTQKMGGGGVSSGEGEMHLYVEGSDTFNAVYGIRFQDAAAGGLVERNDCSGILCGWVPTKRVVPGTLKASPTLVPQPTIPQVALPPRSPMVGGDHPGQAGMPDPILGNVAVASLPEYGTDFFAGTCVGAKCQGRIYFREGHNIGMTSALWGSSGWREVPGGFVSKHKPAVAAVQGQLWLAAVSADGKKLELTKYRHHHGGSEAWDPWTDLTANLVLPAGMPGVFDSPPAIVPGHGFAWVLVRGIDGHLWRRTYHFNTGKFDNEWSVVKPLPMPKGIVATGSRVIQGGVSKTILVAVDSSNLVKYAYIEKSGSTPWMDIPGGGLSDASPAVALSAPDKLTVVVKGRGGSSYWYQTLSSNGTWNSGWSLLPGGGSFDLQTEGPSAVYHAGTYWDPSTPSPGSWDATPTLRVFGDTATPGRTILGGSFVHASNAGLLVHREQGWQAVPGTFVQPPLPTDPKPKPPADPGNGNPLPPAPPAPGTPEWNLAIQTEPINQWYPICLRREQWTPGGWTSLWAQTVFHPGENSEDAFAGATEVYGSDNEAAWGSDVLVPVGGTAYAWNRGAC